MSEQETRKEQSEGIYTALKSIKWKRTLLYACVIAFMGVTLDLMTTRIGLQLGFVESVVLGNRPELEYPVALGAVVFMFFFSNWVIAKEKITGRFACIGRVFVYFVAMQTYIPVISNLMVLNGV